MAQYCFSTAADDAAGSRAVPELCDAWARPALRGRRAIATAHGGGPAVNLCRTSKYGVILTPCSAIRRRKHEVSRLAPRRRHRLPGGAISLSAAESPLIDAVKKQDAQAVRALLKQKANINAAEADGFTALHWAAQRNDLPLVELLLGAGASAKASTRYNITPLYLAAVNGNAAMMERLLNAGADANGTAEEGQTMLMTAALSGKADAVQAAADARREGRHEGAVQRSDRVDVGRG